MKKPLSLKQHLATAVIGITSGRGTISDYREKSWASLTFKGTRAFFNVDFADEDEADAFVALLPEYDFTMPGWLVADATVTGRQKRNVQAEILALEE